MRKKSFMIFIFQEIFSVWSNRSTVRNIGHVEYMGKNEEYINNFGL